MNIVVIIPFFIILCGYLLYHIISWCYHKYIWHVCTDQDIINMDYETKLYIINNYDHWDFEHENMSVPDPIIGRYSLKINSINNLRIIEDMRVNKSYNSTINVAIDLIETLLISEKLSYKIFNGYGIEIMYKDLSIIQIYIRYQSEKKYFANLDFNKYYEKIKDACKHRYTFYEQNYLYK